jgi:hypothetical protein
VRTNLIRVGTDVNELGDQAQLSCGHMIVRVFEFVMNNPGCCKANAAWRLKSAGTPSVAASDPSSAPSRPG